MSNWNRTTIQWISGMLGAALLLSSCAVSVPAPPAAEEDRELALELERSIYEEEDPFAEGEGQALTLSVPQPQPLASAFPDAGQAVVPLSTGDSLAIPATFAITRPEEYTTTTFADYFITGTSDPSQPVYFGEEEIQRLGSKGTFGVHVPLEMGVNTFTLSQGGKSQTVTIARTLPGTTKITGIRQSSMVPAYASGVKAGEKLSVGCIAPAGAVITATFEGKTVTLKQSNQERKEGLAAAFTGKIPVEGNGIPADETQAAGKVKYTMEYRGKQHPYTSSGNVCIAGADSAIAVEVTSYLGFVYNDIKNLGSFKETVKMGARDYVAGQNNEYFKLRSGGYIPKEQAGIVLGKVRVKNSLKDASFQKGGRVERITLHGTRAPVYDTWIKDDVFHLRLYNTTGTPKPSVGDSALVSSCSVSEEDGAVLYRFPLSGRVWGFDVSFDGGDATLSLRRKPSVSSGSLEGVTVVLDPGHGGKDPGALGVAGRLGPTEADVNLANALAVRDRLAGMGADVVMTRQGNDAISLDDRLKLIEDSGADLFVSLHHNSVGVNADANKISGMEIYYHTALSKGFAGTMMSSLATGLNRNNRSVNQSYYRVTLMYHSPALLLELGFMSNPLEYEKAASPKEMEKVADAVCKGVLNALQ